MGIIKSDDIKEKLTYLRAKVSIDNGQGLYDINKTCEDVFMHLLNSTYGWCLKNANLIQENFPAIDLIDEQNNIVIQVTSIIDTTKLKNTIKKFEALDGYDHYQLKMFYIRDKPNFSNKSLDKFAEKGVKKEDLLGIEDILVSVQRDPMTTHRVYATLNQIIDSDTLQKIEIRTRDVKGVVNAVDSEINTYNDCTIYQANNHQEKIDQAPLPDKPPKNLTIIPAKNEHFIGRKQELAEIKKTLASDGVLYIVNGIGGVGKSELASQYLLTHQDAYQHIAFFQFSAENNDLRNTLYQILRQYFYLNQQEEITVEQLIQKLQSLPKKCLFIFDDLANKEDIAHLKPLHHNADVLVTTRLNLPDFKTLHLDILNPDDAKALFLEYYPTNEAIDDILAFIDYHALFIELTAKTLREGCLDLASLREQFNHGDFVKIDRNFENTFNDFLVQRFKIETHAGLKTLLQQLALLPAMMIPYSVLEAILADTPRLKLTLNELAKRGWLAQKADSYKMHQVIKEFILANHSLDFEMGILPVVDQVITLEIGDDLELYINIIKSVYGVCGEQRHEKIVKLLAPLCSIYQHIADYGNAVTYQQKVLVIRENIFGSDSVEVATSFNNLASLHHYQGDYIQAKLLYQRSLSIQEYKLDKDHPHVATSLNNLAELYRFQGQYSQAEPLYQRALSIREDKLGNDHSHVAASLNNLAELYQFQGKYSEAEPLYQRALFILEYELGNGHPHVATSLNNLALLYQNQGKHSQAKSLFQRALSIRKNKLSSDHPDVASSLNNLAELYSSQGEYSQAEPLFQHALSIFEDKLGNDHPNVATSLNNQARLYQYQGKYSQAEPLFQRALSIREDKLGNDHPDVANSLHNLAVLYRVQGKYNQAEALFKRTLLIEEYKLGNNHPSVATSLNNLALLYQDQGKYSQAELLYQRALLIQEDKLGNEHPDVATSLSYLAVLYQTQGKYTQANPIWQRLFAINGINFPNKAAYYHRNAEIQFMSKYCKYAKHCAEKSLNSYQHFNGVQKEILAVKSLLKQIKRTIKKAKKLPLKRRRKLCKDL